MKILKFYADWCAPCKSVSKMMDEINFPCEVVNINIDTEIDEATKYNIRGIPTLILVGNDNNIIKTLSGNITKKDLLALV